MTSTARKPIWPCGCDPHVATFHGDRHHNVKVLLHNVGCTRPTHSRIPMALRQRRT